MKKKVIIISATSFTNLKLSNELNKILIGLDVNPKVINIEDYDLPLFIASDYAFKKDDILKKVKKLTDEFTHSSGIVICAPEYNGSIPPIITNMIAWVSVSTDDWRFAFADKISLLLTGADRDGIPEIESFHSWQSCNKKEIPSIKSELLTL